MYSEERVLSVKASSWLASSSTTTIRTSGLQGTMIIVRIRVRIFYLPPFFVEI
jgi:hypothetical protein